MMNGVMKQVMMWSCIFALCCITCAYAEELAADFTLQNLAGENVTLSSFKGTQNVLVVFGTTWCPYCVEEIATLNQMQAELGNSLKILGVYVQEKKTKLEQFVEKKSVEYEVLVDADGGIAKAYGVRGIPAFFFVDKNGTVRYSGSGALDVQKVMRLAQE